MISDSADVEGNSQVGEEMPPRDASVVTPLEEECHKLM